MTTTTNLSAYSWDQLLVDTGTTTEILDAGLANLLFEAGTIACNSSYNASANTSVVLSSDLLAINAFKAKEHWSSCQNFSYCKKDAIPIRLK
jgi:hypothetical protein